MSSNYTYPGQGFVHTLTALKGWYEEGALDAEVKPSTNVNIGTTGLPVNSGTCMHASDRATNPDPYGGIVDGPGTFVGEMGCAGAQGLPLFVWPGSNDPDISNPGVPAGTPAYGDSTYGAPDALSVFPTIGGEKMPCLVASGGYELETTEFDTDQTFTPGQWLRAVTSNTLATAGKLTNQNASGGAGFASSAAFLLGTDTVVGIVSRGKYTNANKKQALAFWPWFIYGTR